MAKTAAHRQRTPRTAVPGEVYVFPLLDRFGAFSVVRRAGRLAIEIALLDITSAGRPSRDELARAPVLHDRAGKEQRYLVDRRIPWWAELAASRPIERFATRCTEAQWWEFMPAFAFSAWFDHNVRTRFELASLIETTAKRSPKTIHLGAGPLDVGALSLHGGNLGELQELWLTSDSGSLPDSGPIRWDALAALPFLRKLHADRADRALFAFARRFPQLGSLDVSLRGQRVVDLRGTRIRSLTLRLVEEEPVLVRAPPYLLELKIHGPSARLVVEAPRIGFPFTLILDGDELPPRAIAGLERVERISATGLRVADLRRLTPYRRLRYLDLWGTPVAPAVVRSADALPRLRGLRELDLSDFDDLDRDRFPRAAAMPRLVTVSLHLVLKRDVAALRRKLVGVPDLHVITPRGKPKRDKPARRAPPASATRSTAGTPFSAWAEDDPDLARRAGAAWSRAVAAAGALSHKPARADGERIVVRFVKQLNELFGEYGYDTIRREDAGDAVAVLATKLGPNVRAADAQAWFDREREF